MHAFRNQGLARELNSFGGLQQKRIDYCSDEKEIRRDLGLFFSSPIHPLMVDVGTVSELQGDETLTHRKPTSEPQSIIFTVESQILGLGEG